MRVITFGTFDLFHVGHLNILERSRERGSCLIVGVSSDELNASKKGFRPLFPLQDRMRILASLRCVDEVFVEHSLQDKPRYILEHRADVLVMGDDWRGKFDFLSDLCAVEYLPRTPDISTTLLKQRVRFPL
jgi:glycerol-3-phosphate cytidylyltransferase